MENKTITLSNRQAKFFDKCVKKARKIIPNKKKVSEKLRKAGKIIDRLQNVPRCKKLAHNASTFCELLSDYFDGQYQNLPLSTLACLVGAVLYLVLPIDAIPDFIPFAGWLDDAGIFAFVIKAAQNDINEYLAWKGAEIINVS